MLLPTKLYTMGNYHSVESTKSNEIIENIETITNIEGAVETIESTKSDEVTTNVEGNQSGIFETQESNILEIVTTKFDILKKILQIIGEVTSECQFSFQNINEGGSITVTHLDICKCVLLKLVLKGTGFDFYKCSKSQIIARINLSDIHKALNFIGINDTNTDPIIISMKDEKSIFFTRVYDSEHLEQIELPCKEPIDSNIPVSNINFQGKFIMSPKKIKDICERISNVSDFVKISLTENEISFSTKYGTCEFSSRHKCLIKYKNTNQTIENTNQTIENRFEAGKILKFIKYFQSDSEISIYIKEFFPLVMHMPLDNLGNIYVFISPVENYN